MEGENHPTISSALLELSQFQVRRFPPLVRTARRGIWRWPPPSPSSSFFTRKATYITSDKEGEGGEERRGGAGGGGGEGEGDLWCRAAALVVRHAALRRRYLLLHEGNVIISDILNRGLSSFAFSVS